MLPAVLPLGAALAFCAVVLDRQMTLHHLSHEVGRYEAGEGGAESLRAAIDAAQSCRHFCPGDALLLSAIGEADLAEKGAGSLAAARRTIDAALALRPDWGEALAVAASIAAQAGDEARAVATLRHSYAAAPYLRQQAVWRLRFAAAVWPALDEPLRGAVMEEAGWMARIDDHSRMIVEAALGDSAAGFRFARIRAARSPEPAP